MNDRQRRRYELIPLSDRSKDGRVYQVNNTVPNGTVYLRCQNSTICFGTAKLQNGELTHNQAHSEDCVPDERSAIIDAFKQALKDSLTTHWYKLRDLFDQTALVYPEAAGLVTYDNLRSFMVRCRQSLYPPSPADIQGFGDQLGDPRNERTLEYHNGRFMTRLLVDEGGNKHIIIYDAQFIQAEISRGVTKLFVDATFRSTPNLRDAYQLMTLMGIRFNHGIPFIWVIMSRKLQISYLTVFQYIKDNILSEARIDLIMSDFEAAIRNACKEVFPRAHCAGCSTHYDRAVLQNLKSVGLQRIIQTNEEAKFLTKKIMALAYLPSNIIEPQYYAIKNDLPANLKRQFNRFFAYYERYWLRTVTPAGFSVFGLSRRTNNILESYNAKLGHRLETRPSPWDFISKLLALQYHARCDVERLKRHSGGITRHARYQTVHKNNELQKAWKELYYNQITPDEFVIKAAYLKGNIADKIAKESNGREGEDFELTEAPRDLIRPDTDPDYDHRIFRGVFPGPFMRDNAHGRPAEQQANAFAMPERPPTPEERLDHRNILVRPPTPQMQEEEEILLGDPDLENLPVRADPEPRNNLIERPPAPQWLDQGPNDLDEAPRSPELVIIDDDVVPDVAPLIPNAALVPIQEGQGGRANGSRQSRRRKRQRQRRRNVLARPNNENRPDADRPRRDQHIERRNTTEEPSSTCIICAAQEITHAFLPCGHRCCCENCCRRIYYDDELRGTGCPACRGALGRSPVRIFI